MPTLKSIQASPKHEAIYQEACDFLKGLCERNPDLRTVEIVAIIGRMGGYCLAMCYPNERDLTRQIVIENMDRACAQMAPADGIDGQAGRA